MDIIDGKNVDQYELDKLDKELFESDVEVYLDLLNDHLKNVSIYILFKKYPIQKLYDIQKENKDVLEKFIRVFSLCTKLKIHNNKLQDISKKIRFVHSTVQKFLQLN